ncbi:hypothetical protein [Marinibacterium sp. SX1]|uniref:hypothetical protein n=1 Tax=Marinibacterium sp. SX1 TaxID=3388424 RepID=UPI003D184778
MSKPTAGTTDHMTISRGLVIDEPWISHILQGRKDWEMRAQATSVRGWFGLIRKGSGHVVGLARLVECGQPLTADEMIATRDHHCIPEQMIRSGAVSRWVIPWKLADIRQLAEPVPYAHKSGAVTWVRFSDTVSAHLAKGLAGPGPDDRDIQPDPIRTVGEHPTVAIRPLETRPVSRPAGARSTPGSNAKEVVLGRSVISPGNLRNNHFYLTEFMDRFPQDCIGGRNRHEAAPRQVTVDWGGPAPVSTDIDGSKRMFRRRGWVGQLFAAFDASEGDVVVVTSVTPYQLHVRIERG